MTHDQVRQLVRQINPIPDVSMLETVDASVAELERSRDMQVDDRPTAEELRSNRWRAPLIGIAAMAVVLIAGLIYINTGEDDVVSPAQDAVSLLGLEDLEPGAYYVDTDGVESTPTRGTFVIQDEGWSSLGAGALSEDPAGTIDGGRYVSLIIDEIEQVGETPCDGGASVPAGSTAEALGDQFAAMSGFITLQGLTPATAFGQDGYHLVLEVPADCNGETAIAWQSKTWGERTYQAAGQVVEFWFLDVDGTTVMVEATRPAETNAPTVAEINASFDAVLESLVLTS